MLFTPEYAAEQKRLHDQGNYGTAALQWGAAVSALVNSTRAQTLLDYGCGSKRSLLKVVDFDHDVTYQGYDPGVPEFSKCDPAEVVVCIDVLEHIEPELLDNVLDHLQSLTQRSALFTIHCGPAVKVLSDGRNAHLIQQPAEWWLPKLMSRWELVLFKRSPGGFMVVLNGRSGNIRGTQDGNQQLAQPD